MPKLNVVGGGGSCLKSDRLADHEGHGFGLGLAPLFGGQSAAVSAMQQLMTDFVPSRFGDVLEWWRPMMSERRSSAVTPPDKL